MQILEHYVTSPNHPLNVLVAERHKTEPKITPNSFSIHAERYNFDASIRDLMFWPSLDYKLFIFYSQMGRKYVGVRILANTS